MMQSPLETLLRQLVATHISLREEHGGGPVFDLRDHLLKTL